MTFGNVLKRCLLGAPFACLFFVVDLNLVGAQPLDLKDPKVLSQIEIIERTNLGKVHNEDSMDVRVARLWKLYFKQNANTGIPIDIQLTQLLQTTNVHEWKPPAGADRSKYLLPGDELILQAGEAELDNSSTETPSEDDSSELASGASNVIPRTTKPRVPFSFANTKHVEFLLDCSRSMKDTVAGGGTKMDLMKKLVAKALESLPGEIALSLRVFGRNYSPGIDPCSDTQLLIKQSCGVHKRKAIIRKILVELEPVGMSPLTYAFSQTFEKDLAGVDGRTIVILISDGEDTCGFDTEAYFRSCIKRIQAKPNVVVLSLTQPRHRSEIGKQRALARISAGKYYSIDEFDSFFNDLKVLKTPKTK